MKLIIRVMVILMLFIFLLGCLSPRKSVSLEEEITSPELNEFAESFTDLEDLDSLLEEAEEDFDLESLDDVKLE